MAEQKPAVGRIVHYVSYGTPGGEYSSQCRAAIITEVASGLLPEATEQPDEVDSADIVVGLCVLNPTGQFFNRARHDSGREANEVRDIPLCDDLHYAGGTWHWPARV